MGYRTWFYGTVLALIGAFFIISGMDSHTGHANETAFDIRIDGEAVPFTDAEPYINADQRTMVPLRFISENLGASVEWLPATQQVDVRKGETLIQLTMNRSSLLVNGETRQMDTEMVFQSEHQRTFVPLRFVSEYLGSEVDFSRTSGGGYLIELTSSTAEPAVPGDGGRMLPEPDGEGEADLNLDQLEPGTASSVVEGLLGEPDAREMHPLGYEWWVYHDPLEAYVQIAIENGTVRDVYVLTDHYDYHDLTVGMPRSEVFSLFPLEEVLTIEGDGVTYEMNNASGSPIESYYAGNGDTILRLYLDNHAGDELAGIRLMDEETFVQTSSLGFRFSYSTDAGFFHEAPAWSGAQQERLDRSNEQLLYHLVNVNRHLQGLSILDWREDIRAVAYAHSKDMEDNQFFSHTSPTTGGPGDRMAAAGLGRSVAENIAMGQRDAVDANAGLMNSLGHREAILNADFREIGTGASGVYYTQKFVR